MSPPPVDVAERELNLGIHNRVYAESALMPRLLLRLVIASH